MVSAGLRRFGTTQRSEIVAAFAACAVLLIAATFFWIVGSDEGEESEAPAHVYHMGEWVDLSNEEVGTVRRKRGTDVDCDGDVSGQFCAWSGTLRVKIDNVALYNTPSEAGVANKDIQLPSYLSSWEADGSSFCLITLTVENLNANPLGGSTKSGRSGFNVSYITQLEGCESFDQIYFDGMIEGGSLLEGDGNIFFLDQGETETYQVGVVVLEDTKPSKIRIGEGPCIIDIVLSCDDRRDTK